MTPSGKHTIKDIFKRPVSYFLLQIIDHIQHDVDSSPTSVQPLQRLTGDALYITSKLDKIIRWASNYCVIAGSCNYS